MEPLPRPMTLRRTTPSLAGKRVLITGGARGIGAALARRLHERGAHVAVVGLEPELLAEVAASCGDGPWAVCDVTDQAQVDAAVALAVEAFGGLDIVVANAGIAAQLPIVGGIARRSRRIVAPAWVAGVLPVRMTAQRVVDVAVQRTLPKALRLAREEQVGFTTEQPVGS